MVTQVVKKWGNSPAVRLPAAILKAAHLSVDQTITIRADTGRIIIEPALPEYVLSDLVAAITPENKHSDADFGQAQGQELL